MTQLSETSEIVRTSRPSAPKAMRCNGLDFAAAQKKSPGFDTEGLRSRGKKLEENPAHLIGAQTTARVQVKPALTGACPTALLGALIAASRAEFPGGAPRA